MYFRCVVLTILFGGLAFKPAYCQSADLLDSVAAAKPKLSFSVKDISSQVKKAYKKKYNSPLSLSDPGAAYNKTDVIYKNEPVGMLLFLGIEREKLGFVLYETRGISTQCFLIYYKLKKKSVVEMGSVILKSQPRSFEELKHLIIKKEYL